MYGEIDDSLQMFINAQQMFFVATAPLGAGGHINLSPKGLDTFRVIAPSKVAYLDYVGSGAETIAHLRENSRIVIMLCAFQGPPKIVRFHGRGEVLEPPDDRYRELRPMFSAAAAGRAIIVVSIDRISQTCGFGVPLYQFERQRPQLDAWCQHKGEEGLQAYQVEKNAKSIDGLPALSWVEAAPSKVTGP
jgi:hypothetical protein